MLDAINPVDAAGKVLHEAGGHGPLVFLSTLVVIIAALMLAAVVYGGWRVGVFLAPKVSEVVSSHLDLLDVMKSDRASAADDRRKFLEAKDRSSQAIEQVCLRLEKIEKRSCNYPASVVMVPKPGDAG